MEIKQIQRFVGDCNGRKTRAVKQRYTINADHKTTVKGKLRVYDNLFVFICRSRSFVSVPLCHCVSDTERAEEKTLHSQNLIRNAK